MPGQHQRDGGRQSAPVLSRFRQQIVAKWCWIRLVSPDPAEPSGKCGIGSVVSRFERARLEPCHKINQQDRALAPEGMLLENSLAVLLPSAASQVSCLARGQVVESVNAWALLGSDRKPRAPNECVGLLATIESSRCGKSLRRWQRFSLRVPALCRYRR
jgi:hypothetical protein